MNENMVLRDIRGLDAIPWWPPAPGWWIVAGMSLLIVIIFWYKRRQYYYWRIEARQQLSTLRKRLARERTKQVVTDFSELLRRIAMARYGRQACAGLVGEDWLLWLQTNDPQGFNWQEKGQILLSFPYAPLNTPIDVDTLKTLLEATKAWIEMEMPKMKSKKSRFPFFFKKGASHV